MARNDRPGEWHRDFLLNDTYEIEVAGSVEVNDTGGLAPTISYMNPLTAATSFAVGGTATLSESRDHNFTENLQFSIRDIYNDWRSGADRHECPPADTELAGTSGISDFAAMASVSPNLDQSINLTSNGVLVAPSSSSSQRAFTWTLNPFHRPRRVGELVTS